MVLPSFVLELLRQHRLRQEQSIATDLVFCTSGGKHLYQNNVRKWFHGRLKVAGLPPIRLHDLRHSAATLMLSMGVPLKVVQEVLGHSNISMTGNIYAHVLPSMQQEAADRMDALFRQSQVE